MIPERGGEDVGTSTTIDRSGGLCLSSRWPWCVQVGRKRSWRWSVGRSTKRVPAECGMRRTRSALSVHEVDCQQHIGLP